VSGATRRVEIIKLLHVSQERRGTLRGASLLGESALEKSVDFYSKILSIQTAINSLSKGEKLGRLPTGAWWKMGG